MKKAVILACLSGHAENIHGEREEGDIEGKNIVLGRCITRVERGDQGVCNNNL